MGIIDRPAPIGSLLKYPQLYTYYQDSLTNWGQFRWCFGAFVQAHIIFWINVCYFDSGAPLHPNYGADSSLWVFGMFIYFSLVLVANVKALVETNSITLAGSLSVGVAIFSVSLLVLHVLFYTFLSLYIPLLPKFVGGMLYMIPLYPLLLVLTLVLVATMLPDIVLKVFRRTWRADMQDEMLWKEGFRGPSFKLLYQPIFKMCDIVGLKTYGELESNRYGFAFAQDDGLAMTQMDLLKGCSEEDSATPRTAELREMSAEEKSGEKPNERSGDDLTVESSASARSTPPRSLEGTGKIKRSESKSVEALATTRSS
ncbi:unnamed protein product [Heligmosomoides polygyrus]|uniref:PhoLip_ATPase_C domain-containing protein n=1 Tax=Heligmosomoides polygyrus TaxID=6339 RepID=A0A183GEX8_HELPZ|nr:unnamed protein product [Heligmosomoides polygyrus]